jgi:hypothetical protein
LDGLERRRGPRRWHASAGAHRSTKARQAPFAWFHGPLRRLGALTESARDFGQIEYAPNRIKDPYVMEEHSINEIYTPTTPRLADDF